MNIELETTINITKNEFDNILSFVNEKGYVKAVSYDLTISNNNGRFRYVVLEKKGIIVKHVFERKKRLETYCQQNIRFKKSIDKQVSKSIINDPKTINLEEGYKRLRRRITFKINSCWLIELGELYSREIDDSVIQKYFEEPASLFENNLEYELEAEWLLHGKKPNTSDVFFLSTWIDASKNGFLAVNAFDVLIMICKKLRLWPTYISLFVKPVTIDKNGLPKDSKFVVSRKADGVTVIVSIGKTVNVIGERFKTYLKAKVSTTDEYIAIGELINNKIWLFDCLLAEGVNIINLPFEKRYTHLIKIINMKLDIDNHSFNIKRTFTNYIDVFSDKDPYPDDGLIFNEMGKPYRKTRIFKYKPLDKQTIDLKAKVNGETIFLYAWNNVKGKDGCTIYAPVKFAETPVSQVKMNIQNDIVYECNWNGKYWIPFKVRTDKSIGNNIRVAKHIVSIIKDPPNLEDLLK